LEYQYRFDFYSINSSLQFTNVQSRCCYQDITQLKRLASPLKLKPFTSHNPLPQPSRGSFIGIALPHYSGVQACGLPDRQTRSPINHPYSDSTDVEGTQNNGFTELLVQYKLLNVMATLSNRYHKHLVLIE
jgi:hypothetical protein